MDKNINNKLVFGKYKFLKTLGKGSFGFVIKGKNVITEEYVAIKVEDWKNMGNILEGEAYFLFYLKGPGIPEVKSFGVFGKYKILVETLLGDSIEVIFNSKNQNFTLKDVCMIAIQLLDRLEFIHSKFIIHRDLKPDNIMVDLETKRIIYLIDFGLAKKYRSSRTLRHIKFTIPRRLTGTARYASVNALRGTEQSRRDDLESLGYILIYLINKGYLPWQGLNIPDKLQRYRKIHQIKKEIKPEKLCKGLPEQFCRYFKYVKKLQFEEDPNYSYLKGLFFEILNKNGFNNNDSLFSWLNFKERENNLKSNNINNYENRKKKTSPRTRILKNIENNREIENNLKKIDGNKLISELEEKQEQREKKYLNKKKNQKTKNIYITNLERDENSENIISNNEKGADYNDKYETQLSKYNLSLNIGDIDDEKNSEKSDLKKKNQSNKNSQDKIKIDSNNNNETSQISYSQSKKGEKCHEHTHNNIPIIFNLDKGSFNNAPIVKCLSQNNIKNNFKDIVKDYHPKNERISIKNPVLTEEFIQNNIISKIKTRDNNINKDNNILKKERNVLANKSNDNINNKRKNINIKLNEENLYKFQNRVNANKSLENIKNINKINILKKEYISPIHNIKIQNNNNNKNNIKLNKNISNININNLPYNNNFSKNLKKINLYKINNITNINDNNPNKLKIKMSNINNLNGNSQDKLIRHKYNINNINSQHKIIRRINTKNINNNNMDLIQLNNSLESSKIIQRNYNKNLYTPLFNNNITGNNSRNKRNKILELNNSFLKKIQNKVEFKSEDKINHGKRKIIQNKNKIMNKLIAAKSQKTLGNKNNNQYIKNTNNNYINSPNINNAVYSINNNHIFNQNKIISIYKKDPYNLYNEKQRLKRIRIEINQNQDVKINNVNFEPNINIKKNFILPTNNYFINDNNNNIFNNSYINPTKNNFNVNIINNNNVNTINSPKIRRQNFLPNFNDNMNNNNNIKIILSGNNLFK